ncbi:MAG: hypothetical protein GC200_10500 [Tepidisphaera sp.]|nr:hypothetical protein [Tepidisphaera sp.]
MTSHHAHGPEIGGDYDALADLFLAEPAADAGPSLRLTPSITQEAIGDSAAVASKASAAKPAARPARPVHIEGLLMGHLPVLGGAWVTQYAKHVADQSHQPVAVVRAQAGTLSVDLVLPRGASAKVNSRIGAGVQGDDLSRALMHAGQEASHWLVRVDEIDEPELLAQPRVQSVTLLTGADDAAVVASYRTIKNLMAAIGAREDGAAPNLGVAIMGAGEEDAGEAEQKIRKAARTFLAADLRPAARVGRVGACTTQTLYRAESDLSLARVIDQVLKAAQAASQIVEPKPSVDATLPEVGAASLTPNAERRAPNAPAPTASLSGVQSTELLGLTPLSSQCPYAPGVVLAAGEGGRLHLVIASSQAGGECSLDEGVKRLLTAAAWADDHASLLEAAHGDALAGVRQHGPTLHLLTADAKSARGLLDTGVKVHLLTTAQARGETVTLVHALN